MTKQLVYDIMPPGWDDPGTPEAPAEPLYDCGYEPGIYFGLDESEYHQIPCFSNSGIKEMLVSCADFWAQSWMNPLYERTGSTKEQELGNGYHLRLLEGRDGFHARYAPEFNKADYEGALDTNDELRSRLKELGVSGYSGKKKSDLIDMVLEADPRAEIMDVLKQDHEASHEGKDFLPEDNMRQIEMAAYMMERDPTAINCFRGGYPEVTVIWICAKTGVPMKARIDYLKIKAVIDLKSFSNPRRKSLDKALADTVAGRKYDIQVATYTEADAWARLFAAKGMVYGNKPAEKWLSKYAGSQCHKFVFVFQQTGISPITRVRGFPTTLMAFRIASDQVLLAKEKFNECFKHFGPETRWLDLEEPNPDQGVQDFTDEDFPLWMYD